MLKVLGEMAIGSGAIAGGGNTIGIGALLGVCLRILLSIIGAIFHQLALLQVVLFAALDGTQGLLYLACCQGHFYLHRNTGMLRKTSKGGCTRLTAGWPASQQKL